MTTIDLHTVETEALADLERDPTDRKAWMIVGLVRLVRAAGLGEPQPPGLPRIMHVDLGDIGPCPPPKA